MIVDLARGPAALYVSGQPIDAESGRPIHLADHPLPAGRDREGWLRFAKSLRGQFAIIASAPDSAVVVTDLTGTWPVFRLRAAHGGVSMLATSLAELESASSRAVRRTALYQYVAFGCMDLNRETIYSDIDRAPSASITFYSRQAEQSVSYADWNELATGACNDLEAAGGILERLIRSHIAANLYGDRHARAALLLSGGTDSALLAAVLRQDMAGDLSCLTQDFRFRKYSECGRARENARLLGFEATPVLLTRRAHFRAVRALNSAAQDQPCATVQAFNLWSLIDSVRKRGGAFIVGEHADSLFLGFGHFFHGLPAERNEYLAATSAMSAQQKILWVTPKPGLDEAGADLLSALGYSKSDYLEWHAAFTRAKTSKFMEFAGLHLTLMQQLEGQIDGGLGWQRIMLPVMRSVPGARILSPFFDPAVVALALGLAVPLKYRDGRTKFLLRHMLRKHINREMPKAPAAASPAAIWRLLPSPAERNAVSPTLRSFYQRVTLRNIQTRGRAVNRQIKAAALGIWMQSHGL